MPMLECPSHRRPESRLRLPLSSLARPLAAAVAALGLAAAVAAGTTPIVAVPGAADGVAVGAGDPDSTYGETPATADPGERQRLIQQVERLGADNRQQQETIRQLRQRLDAAGAGSRWAPVLAMALGAVLLIAGWLALRLRQLLGERRREREDARLQRLIEATADDAGAAHPATAMGGTTATAGTAAPVHSAAEATQRLDRTAVVQAAVAAHGAALPRAVSVEEMLDLEQQADFFVVLGQEEAAIELLVSHIRDSGAAGAMPYLKLMEIYRQRGDGEGYERMRVRLEQGFNAVAPGFAEDPVRGRHLDQYPGVLRHIEQAWQDPARALAELEVLMTRRDGAEPFDLPAYRELMLLAAVAQDLSGAHGAPVTGVDIPLPLEAEVNHGHSVRRALAARLGATQPLPPELIGQRRGQRGGERASPGLDLDLSDGAPAPRESARSAAFTGIEARDAGHRADPGGFDEIEPTVRTRRL